MLRVVPIHWFPYLALSLSINLTVILFSQIESAETAPHVLPALKISLNALAARAATPQTSMPEEVMHSATPPASRVSDVATDEKAKKEVVSTQKRDREPQRFQSDQTEMPSVRPKTKPVDIKTSTMKREITHQSHHEQRNVPPGPEVREEEVVEDLGESEHRTTDHGREQSTVIHTPSYRKQTPPTYPRRAIELGQQGNVLLHALVSADGTTQKLKIAETSGYRLLDLAALAAVERWEFEPININGEPIPGWVQVPVKFKLR